MRARRNDLTQQQVRELFDYDQANGVLIWRQWKGGTGRAGAIAGSATKQQGYINVSIKRRLYRAHRIIWLWHYGTIPDYLDHIDGNTANNRIENLREVTNQENCQRRRKWKTATSSRWKGVSRRMSRHGRQRWSANCRHSGKQWFLGYFQDEADAAMAYNLAASEAFGEFAALNDHPLNQEPDVRPSD